MRIGFIGLGRIGNILADRCAKAGHELTLFDVSASVVVESAALHHAAVAISPSDMARQVDVIVISVPGPDEDAAAILGKDGVLAQAQTGLLIIDTTTSIVALSRDIASRCAACGVEYLDAPVSAGGSGAITVMVGGEEATYRRARPVLGALSSYSSYLGPSGSGTAAKLLNQSIYIAYMTAFAEGLALGESMGLPRDALLEALGNASAGNPHIVTKYPEIQGGSSNRFAIASALRYLRAAADACRHANRMPPVLTTVTQSLSNAAADGAGSEDIIVARDHYIRYLKQSTKPL